MNEVTKDQVVEKFNEFVDLLIKCDANDDIAVLCFFGEQIEIDGKSKIHNTGIILGNKDMLLDMTLSNMADQKNTAELITNASFRHNLLSLSETKPELSKALSDLVNRVKNEQPVKEEIK